ncbi:MAG TPA: hypothetical protein VMM78_18025 [Thermomicrobiales bacterium]|nr:hypothetical protein [Thermomicrobiales bacterium]
MPKLEPLTAAERPRPDGRRPSARGLMAGGLALVAGCVLLALWALPATSPLRTAISRRSPRRSCDRSCR